MTTSPTSLDRRSFVRLLTAISVGGLSAAAGAQTALRFAAPPYRMGIASGAPSTDGFVLWTRLFGPELAQAGDVPVDWEVFDAAKPTVVLAKGTTPAVAELGHSVHVEVSGLAPDRWYGYRFNAGGSASINGRTRTLPAAGAASQRLRLAYASCQRWEDGYFSAYRQMVADAPDLVLFVGDYIYEAAGRKADGPVRTHDLKRVQTLQDYRDRYALYRSDADLQAMHAAAPWLLTWDDHEVENNYVGNLSIRERKNIAGQRNQAYQAYYENMPLRASVMLGGLKGLQTTGGFKLYGSVDFGKLARIYMLDNRQYRTKPLCGDDGPNEVCERADSGGRTMLGAEQERWLAASLADAAKGGFPWNVIAQETRVSTASYKRGPNGSNSTDSWDGFPAARQRFIDTIGRSRAKNPVIVGGDIHENWVANVHANPFDVRSPVVAAEFVGTSISAHPDKTADKDERKEKTNPHCLLADSQHRGYGLLDITPKDLRATLKKVDDPTRPGSRVSTLASFTVRQGDPTVRQG